MKVKCLKCGLVYGVEVWWKQSCPQCGEVRYVMKLEDFEKIPDRPKVDRESLEMVKDLLGEAYDMAKLFLKEQEDLMRDPFKAQREAIEKQMDTLDPFHYRKKCKEAGLAFEIFEVFNNKKINVRKIYFDGHIEGFRRNPFIVNRMYPKIQLLKSFAQNMNEEYRNYIRKCLLSGYYPTKTLDSLYQEFKETIERL